MADGPVEVPILGDLAGEHVEGVDRTDHPTICCVERERPGILLRVAEMFRRMPFPFDNNEFPADLGAVVQRSVLDGVEPAREVVHTDDGDWLVGDGVNDPNSPGAAVATHIWHAIERNSSIIGLGHLRPGQIATRSDPDEEWVISDHQWVE